MIAPSVAATALAPALAVRSPSYPGPVAVSRNSRCPCGSGRKHKHCCLEAERRAARAARFDDAVGKRIHDWSSATLGDEIATALEELGPGRTTDDAGLQIFAVWFHNDRELPGGGTPAQRYAARADLRADERAAALRIASARLGVHRVLAVEPGSSIELEDVLRGTRARVRSDQVSREAVRWDLLLGRVMEGDPLSLWGPVRLFEPDDEPELLGELERLAAIPGGERGERGLEATLRRGALELMRFKPKRWSVEPSFFTLEGDPMATARARWRLRDRDAVRVRFAALPGAWADPRADLYEVEIAVPREALVANRPELPAGALVFEAGTLDDLDRVPVATVRLEAGELSVDAMSAERLELASELVERDFDDLIELAEREVVPVERRLDELDSRARRRHEPPPGVTAAEERRMLADFMTDRLRRWLEEPHRALNGLAPRQAAARGRRAEVEGVVRVIENRSERAQRRGEPFADVAWIRSERGLEGEPGREDELAA